MCRVVSSQFSVRLKYEGMDFVNVIKRDGREVKFQKAKITTAIQKARESFRITPEQKEYLNTLKIKTPRGKK